MMKALFRQFLLLSWMVPVCWAADSIQVGVAWQDKVIMPERVLTGIQKTLSEEAPQIHLDIRRALPDMDALDSAISEFERTKQAMVILRSNGAQLLGRRGVSIPTFLGGVNNPVELGAAYSLERAKTNLAGVTYYIPNRFKLESFRQIYPTMSNILLLVEAGHPGTALDVKETEEASSAMGLSLRIAVCATLEEVLTAVREAAPDETLILGVEALIMDHVPAIVREAGDHIVFGYPEQAVADGALASLSADDEKLGRMLGRMMIEALVKGRPLSEMGFRTDPEPRLLFNYHTLHRFKDRIPFAIQSLARAEQMLKSILRAAPTGIGLVVDRVLVEVNDYILNLTGYTRDELIGQSARILYPTQEDYEYVGREKYRQIALYGTGSVETRWRCKDGSTRQILLSSTLLNPTDIYAGTSFTALDITARKETEASLAWRTRWFLIGIGAFVLLLMALVGWLAMSLRQRKRVVQALGESETRYRAIFDSNMIGVGCWGPDGELYEVNDAYLRIIHKTREQFNSGQVNWKSITPPESRVQDEHAIEVMMTRGSCDPYEKEYLLEDGRRVSALIVGVLLRREPVMGLAFALDISERKADEEARLAMERQVQHTQKLESLGVLAGGIAHDFNNLLTAILGHTELALDVLSPMSPGRDNLHEIEKVTCRAAELAKQMLAYSGKGQFVTEPIDVGVLIEQMGHLLEVAISKRVDIQYRLAPNLPVFEGDPTQTRQIIMNLITNASEAVGDKDGVIALSTGCMHCDRDFLDEAERALRTTNDSQLPEGAYVYFEVTDSGIGMDKTTAAKIFDPFFTTKFTGRGLGMSAVLGIIRGHRGFIRIYSELGCGSTFRVFFPVSDAAGGAVADAEPSASDWRGEGLILLADDEEYVRDVGRKMLERLGFEVLVAVDGQEAVDLYEKRGSEICCVLLDLTMPRLSGYEAFCALRRINPEVQVLLASGYSEQSAIDRFAGKGLGGFIQKPYSFRALRDKLAGCWALDRPPVGE